MTTERASSPARLPQRGRAAAQTAQAAAAPAQAAQAAAAQAAAQRACRHAAAAARMHTTGRGRVAHRGSRGLAGGRRRRATAEREGFGERKARVSKRYNWLHGS